MALFAPPIVLWLSARSPNAEFHTPVVRCCNAPDPSLVLPKGSEVSGTSPRAFLRYVTRRGVGGWSSWRSHKKGQRD